MSVLAARTMEKIHHSTSYAFTYENYTVLHYSNPNITFYKTKYLIMSVKNVYQTWNWHMYKVILIMEASFTQWPGNDLRNSKNINLKMHDFKIQTKQQSIAF